MFNNENDCASPDASIGIGIQTDNIAAGGQYGCCASNGKDQDVTVTAKIYVWKVSLPLVPFQPHFVGFFSDESSEVQLLQPAEPNVDIQCKLAYCNAHTDLQATLCGGQPCSTLSQASACYSHFQGLSGRRQPNPDNCLGSDTSSSCKLCDNDFQCVKNEEFQKVTFLDPLRTDSTDPSEMREIESMKIRISGSMSVDASKDSAIMQNTATDETNIATLSFNGQVVTDSLLGAGTEEDLICGECHHTTELVLDAKDSILKDHYKYSVQDDQTFPTNEIAIAPPTGKAWCIAKVQIAICAKMGPPVIKYLEREDGGSLDELNPAGGDLIKISGANLGEIISSKRGGKQ